MRIKFKSTQHFSDKGQMKLAKFGDILGVSDENLAKFFIDTGAAESAEPSPEELDAFWGSEKPLAPVKSEPVIEDLEPYKHPVETIAEPAKAEKTGPGPSRGNGGKNKAFSSAPQKK